MYHLDRGIINAATFSVIEVHYQKHRTIHAMSGRPDQSDEPRKLRRNTRSVTLQPTPEKPSQETKRHFSFFKSDKKTSKRKRSPFTIVPGENMADSKPDASQDVQSAFANGLETSLSRRPEYEAQRENLLRKEGQSSWDASARATASKAELRAAEILWKIREDERENLFGNKASEAIPGPETLDMGGQVLTNRKRILGESDIYRIAHKMPKGAHLHLHFNSEFPPHVLLSEAKNFVKDTLFIRSTQPIITLNDLAQTEMVFNVLPADTETANLFSHDYSPEFKAAGSKPWMKWTKFCDDFRSKPEFRSLNPEKWIETKMTLSEDEVYGIKQTTNGIWARFNQGTRCFKGLMGYESIFRWYIGHCIDSMIEEKVMFAELRPMLLDKSIPDDSGIGRLNHDDQMTIIEQECDKKKKQLEAEGRLEDFPFGLKIIYCTPRSIPKTMMRREMEDCIKLKLKFPDLICGFDLVGAEDRPNHIGFYKDELLAFTETCKTLNISIPFMFHAGETLLDRGGSRNPANSNLYDSVLFNAKRIGHGFSLVKHPDLAKEFRDRKICIELCPTSNELLHLCRNIKEHPYPDILAFGIPCTINSDNPSLFRADTRNSSSLSLEFYQVMVGSPTMNLHGWRQLAEWSLEYSCLSASQLKEAKEIFKKEWEKFCTWIIEEYGQHADGLDITL